MLTERVQQQSYTSTKYYQFATFLEHVIDCFHTIVSDETNPYHPPLAWLTRKQPKPPEEELFQDLIQECSQGGSLSKRNGGSKNTNKPKITQRNNDLQLSYNIRCRLERCSPDTRLEIVSRTKDGCAPLFMACQFGLTNVAKYLITICKADIEQKGLYEVLEDNHIHSVSPIWVSSVSGHYDLVKLLIECGANLNSLSDTGSTPLRSVCFLCKDDDGIDDVNVNDIDDNGELQFDADAMFGPIEENNDERKKEIECDSYLRIVKLLVEHGADVKLSNYNGGSCLINSSHNLKLAEYILDHGADVNATDNQSKTALHYAIQQDRFEVIKLLLERGANPFIRANNTDDALQLSCLGGNMQIFQYLVDSFHYPPERLADAYKLLGSSILEIYHDLTRVRELWLKSLQYESLITSRDIQDFYLYNNSSNLEQGDLTDRIAVANNNHNGVTPTCDIRRSIAYGDMIEFRNEQELQALTVEDFKIQSLLISERILGASHRETIQRLLYRGTFYINSLRPDKCIDLWIYALKLRLDYDSIFHFESIFAAQAITKLFLDLFSQQQQHQIKFCDVYDVLDLLVERLDDCRHHLSWRPTSCLHEDIFDLLLGIIVNLLLALRCIAKEKIEIHKTHEIMRKIIQASPTSSNGSSLLHICFSSSIFDSDAYRSLTRGQEVDDIDRVDIDEMHDEVGQLENVNFAAAAAVVMFNNNNHASIRQQHQLPDRPNLVGQIGRLVDQNKRRRKSPVVDLIDTLIDLGLGIDLANKDGFSALQMLCLAANISSPDKKHIIRLLVERGAHVDRRTVTSEQDARIRHALREAGINPLNHTTLACLAARQVSKLSGLKQLENQQLARHLKELIAIH